MTLPCYRGDLVNRLPFTLEDRTPNPALMLRGYERSALTLNFIRALVNSEFSASSHSEYWDLNTVRASAGGGRILLHRRQPSGELLHARRVLLQPRSAAASCTSRRRRGAFPITTDGTTCRRISRGSGCGPSDPDGAHVEYCKGIANPRLPAQTLLAIRDDPARRPVMRHFNEFRRTGTVDAGQLNGAVENFLYSAEQIAYSDARGELRDLIKRRRRERRRANLTILRDTGLAVAGVSIWGEIGSIVGYAGLAVTACASIHALRNYGKEYRHGYAVGRMVPPEHRLVLNHLDGRKQEEGSLLAAG